MSQAEAKGKGEMILRGFLQFSPGSAFQQMHLLWMLRQKSAASRWLAQGTDGMKTRRNGYRTKRRFLFHDLSITDALGEPDEWPVLNLRLVPIETAPAQGTMPRPSFHRMLWGHWHPVHSQVTPATFVPSRLS